MIVSFAFDECLMTWLPPRPAAWQQPLSLCLLSIEEPVDRAVSTGESGVARCYLVGRDAQDGKESLRQTQCCLSWLEVVRMDIELWHALDTQGLGVAGVLLSVLARCGVNLEFRCLGILALVVTEISYEDSHWLLCRQCYCSAFAALCL